MNIVLPNYKVKWKQIANANKNTFNDTVIYVALKAFFAKTNDNKVDVFKNITSRTFTSITNINRISNGELQPFHYVISTLKNYYNNKGELQSIFGIDQKNILSFFFSEDTFKYNEFVTFIKDICLNFKDDIMKLTSTVKNYSYIIVDQKNVEPIYQAVQLAHVAMKIGQNMDGKYDAANVYYQIVKLPESELFKDLLTKFHINNIKHEYFYEQDIDRVIAIGTHPINKRKIPDFLKELPLLSF